MKKTLSPSTRFVAKYKAFIILALVTVIGASAYYLYTRLAQAPSINFIGTRAGCGDPYVLQVTGSCGSGRYSSVSYRCTQSSELQKISNNGCNTISAIYNAVTRSCKASCGRPTMSPLPAQDADGGSATEPGESGNSGTGVNPIYNDGSGTITSPRNPAGSATPQTDDPKVVACQKAGGTWLAKYNECESKTLSQSYCTQYGGNYLSCASSCRHNPTMQACPDVCMRVCQFGTFATGNAF